MKNRGRVENFFLEIFDYYIYKTIYNKLKTKNKFYENDFK